MDLALTLISLASFFALVLAWTVLPPSTSSAESARTSQPIREAQTAH